MLRVSAACISCILSLYKCALAAMPNRGWAQALPTATHTQLKLYQGLPWLAGPLFHAFAHVQLDSSRVPFFQPHCHGALHTPLPILRPHVSAANTPHSIAPHPCKAAAAAKLVAVEQDCALAFQVCSISHVSHLSTATTLVQHASCSEEYSYLYAPSARVTPEHSC